MSSVSALTPGQLAAELGLASLFRGRQIFSWIHRKLVFDFSRMSDLPQQLRAELSRRARTLELEPGTRLCSPDGAVKQGFQLSDGLSVEAVLLQDGRGRRTACLSTQVGCGMGCRFCRTGANGYRRDLEAHEIVEQLLLLRAYVRDRMRVVGVQEISNLVFMGMGEPLANLDHLEQAVKVFTSPAGSALSPRRITISTCGLVRGIRSLASRRLGLRLAVSLISADPRVRSRLMPVAGSNPLPELRRALLEYQEATPRRITLEIVLMGGINDRLEDVEALIRFVRGSRPEPPLKALVNLIPWNPVPQLAYRSPDAARIKWFEDLIRKAGVPVTTRISRGSAVGGACGQLGLPQETPSLRDRPPVERA